MASGDRKERRVHVRFTTFDGAQWSVYDVTWSNKKHHRPPHGDPTATERLFVNAEGVKRAYKFKPSDSRRLEEQALERQLKAAACMPTSKPDPKAPVAVGGVDMRLWCGRDRQGHKEA